MKWLIAFLIASLVSVSSLFSAPVMDGSVPSNAEAVLISALDGAASRKPDIDVSFSDYRTEETADGILVSVEVAYNGKSERIEGFGSDETTALDSLASSLTSLMYYDKTLYADAESHLEYIYGKSYSMKRPEGIRLGTRFSLVDSDNRIHGIFVVSDHYADYDSLKPLYIKNPLPGMELRKGSSFEWSADYGISFPVSTHYASFTIGNTALIYPIKPILQAVYLYNTSTGSSFYGGVGISARASISSLFRTSFTLFEEGSIGATASLLAGYSAGAFSLKGSYSIYYEHRAAPHFAWRIGYLYTPDGKHALTLGIGGDL